MTTDKIVEIGARALFGERWDDLAPIGQANIRRSMTNVLTELRAAGYEVVPVEPTEAMLKAGRKRRSTANPYLIYRAMIAAKDTET